jgi:hypothetical protein
MSGAAENRTPDFMTASPPPLPRNMSALMILLPRGCHGGIVSGFPADRIIRKIKVHHPIARVAWKLNMQMLRSRFTAGAHEGHEPPDAHTHGTVDALQGDCLPPSAFYQRASLLFSATIFSMQDPLSALVFAPMMLFAGGGSPFSCPAGTARQDMRL